MKTVSKVKRIWELDFLRGIAIIIMIRGHTIFDLNEFYGYPIQYSEGFNYYIGRVGAVLFILISGISCSLSRSNFKRGIKVLAIAVVLSIATHIYSPEMGIKFGILHFLGTSMLLYSPLRKLNKYGFFVLGTIIFAANFFIHNIQVSFDIFFPLGIISNNFVSSDYYPLIPYLGIFLYGTGVGKTLYVNKRSIINYDLKENIINWLGRKSLIIYLLHQPVIIIVIELLIRLT